MLITIMTPVYNRAYIIENLYHSLLRQTNREFEWILIDDGSVDGLMELVEKWEKDESRYFNLKYIYQENGGKHRALNNGMKYAKGEYTYIVDSDDYLTDDALEKIHGWLKQINGKPGFAGVSGTKGSYQHGELRILGSFPKGRKYVDCTNLERRRKRLCGDKAEVYNTKILKRYPFPEFEGEKMLPEAAVWDRVASDGLKIRWFPDVVYICEYLPDGLTRADQEKLCMDNINGFLYCAKVSGKKQSFPYNFNSIGHTVLMARKKGVSNAKICEAVGISRWYMYCAVGVRKMILRWKKL